jgi:putative oxidoreductase
MKILPPTFVTRTISAPDARSIAELAARLFLGMLFLSSGIDKIGAYAETATYMNAAGVPGVLLPAVIAIELLGATVMALGWKTRLAAALLAGFSLAAAALFHAGEDSGQAVQYLKNLAIAGGFLLLVVHGAGPLSLDRALQR